MKFSILVLACILSIATTVNSAPRTILPIDQAKAMAIEHVKVLSGNYDISVCDRVGVAPTYSIVKVDHVIGADYFQVLVKRTANCQKCALVQSVVMDNSTGELNFNAPMMCEEEYNLLPDQTN